MRTRVGRPTKAEEIARAALALFVEEGVRGATTRAIARRARTTEGNLYRYYASKQDLARHVLTRCLLEFGAFLALALEGRTEPRDRLRAFVHAYVEYALAHPAEHALIVEAHLRDLGELPPDLLRPRHVLVELLGDGVARGAFAPCDPGLATPFIAGGLARAVQVHAALGGTTSAAGIAERLADQVERLVGVRRDDGPDRGPSPPSPPSGPPCAGATSSGTCP